MHVTNIKKSVAECLLVMTSFLLVAEPIMGTEQEFRTLKLIRTYRSEEELQATYPELFPQQTIKETNDSIIFYDPQTQKPTKQLEKVRSKILREEKRGTDTIVFEEFHEYKTSTDASFVLYTEYERGYPKGNPHADIPELRIKPQMVALYNAKGEKITQLPTEVNVIKIAPDKQSFLAYGEGEEPSKYLYLYSMDGVLLKKEEMNGYLVAAYSQEGAFFPVFDAFGRKFSIFSKTGKKVYENDYTTLIGDVQPILYGVFVSENGTSFLLHTSGRLSLFTLDNQLLWDRSFPPGSAIYGCRFYSSNGVVIVISRGEKSRIVEGIAKSFQKLQIISLNSGQVVDEIEGITYTRLFKEAIIVQKEGIYYEYTVK